MVPHSPIIVWSKVSITLLCQLYSTCYTVVLIKNCLKGTSVINIVTLKNMDDFRYAKEAIICNHQINAFHCQQRWIEHKGEHWQVPEEFIATYCGMQKAPLRLKSDSEKIKPHMLIHYQVTLVWRHQLVSLLVSLLVSQAVEILLNIFFKFSGNFLKTVQIDLKACLGLVLPNQYCPIIIWENWGWFSGDFTLLATPTSWLSLLWTTIVIHDTIKQIARM